MGNDEHDSKPVEGILDSGSHDIVDTLWDIPPLSFPESEPVVEEPFLTGRRVVSSSGKDESEIRPFWPLRIPPLTPRALPVLRMLLKPCR